MLPQRENKIKMSACNNYELMLLEQHQTWRHNWVSCFFKHAYIVKIVTRHTKESRVAVQTINSNWLFTLSQLPVDWVLCCVWCAIKLQDQKGRIDISANYLQQLPAGKNSVVEWMENPYRKKLKVWPAAECTLKVEQSLQKIMSGLFVFEAHDIRVSPERTLL